MRAPQGVVPGSGREERVPMVDKGARAAGRQDLEALKPDEIRNVVLVGPSSGGKTTLLETLLVHSGALTRAGTVAEGTTVSDFEAGERSHGRSMSLSVAPVVHRETSLDVFKEDKVVDLFRGGPGTFPDVAAWEPTERFGLEANDVSTAVTSDAAARPVIAAVEYGKGLVLRTGFPGFAQRLASDTDPATTALMARMWTLLSR